jgi:hypothetical protein
VCPSSFYTKEIESLQSGNFAPQSEARVRTYGKRKAAVFDDDDSEEETEAPKKQKVTPTKPEPKPPALRQPKRVS